MKNHPRLIRQVCWLIGILRWAPPLVIVVAIGTLLFPFQPVKGTVDFAVSAVSLQPTGPHAGNATLATLSGTVLLPCDPDTTPELAHISRSTAVPTALVPAIAWTVILNLIFQLCRAVDRGEIFSDRTLRLVQWLGITLIMESIATCAAATWAHVVLNRYLLTHYTFGGLTIANPTNPFTLQGTSGTWVIGLLVLVLAEVFRQGLTLRRETELTV